MILTTTCLGLMIAWFFLIELVFATSIVGMVIEQQKEYVSEIKLSNDLLIEEFRNFAESVSENNSKLVCK